MKTEQIRTMIVAQCAHCKSDYLHHHSVRIFRREQEDSSIGTFISFSPADGVNVLPRTGMKENPSGRRDGIVILCDCEECSKTTYILIWQGKGQTFIDVSRTPSYK